MKRVTWFEWAVLHGAVGLLFLAAYVITGDDAFGRLGAAATCIGGAFMLMDAGFGP